MSQPKIVGKCFQVVDLKAGRYFWCACGESKNQPFCDGSHKGTVFSPVAFDLPVDKRVKLCLCKHTKAAAGICDGSHNSL